MDSKRVPMTRAHYGVGINTKRAIVIHATAGTNSYDWLRNGGSSDSPVSCHYLISKSGVIWQYVDVENSISDPHDLIMWHAGPSTWNVDGEVIPDAQGLNPVAIGIELENKNNGLDDYPQAQYRAVVELTRYLVHRYDIPVSQVVRHVDIAYGRKSDPVGFPWDQFQRDIVSSASHLYEYFVVTPSAGVYEQPGGSTIALNGTAFLPNGERFRGYESTPGWIHREDGLGFVSTDNLVRVSGLTLIRAADVTPTTSLMSGTPACTREQVRAYMARRSTGEYTSADVDLILMTYSTICVQTGLDFGLVAAQVILETDNLNSFWSARPQRNPAGIGVDGTAQTGKPAEYQQNWAYNPQRKQWERGLSFASWVEHSIPAHVGRLLAYILIDASVSDTPSQPEDIRTWYARCRELIDYACSIRPMPKHLRGSVQELRHLSVAHNPTGLGWATDPQYAEKIVRIVNDIRKGA